MRTALIVYLIGLGWGVLVLTLHIWHCYKADLRAWWKARKTLRFLLTMIGTYLLLGAVVLLLFFGLIITTP